LVSLVLHDINPLSTAWCDLISISHFWFGQASFLSVGLFWQKCRPSQHRVVWLDVHESPWILTRLFSFVQVTYDKCVIPLSTASYYSILIFDLDMPLFVFLMVSFAMYVFFLSTASYFLIFMTGCCGTWPHTKKNCTKFLPRLRRVSLSLHLPTPSSLLLRSDLFFFVICCSVLQCVAPNSCHDCDECHRAHTSLHCPHSLTPSLARSCQGLCSCLHIAAHCSALHV